ncbi:MAG: PBP1A family penicillin-binding protein [Candidatus Eiseniibacteriota bacterium]|jgi:penicillin-binding protein 1A
MLAKIHPAARRYLIPVATIAVFIAIGSTWSLLRWADRRIPSPYRLTDIRPPLKTLVLDRHGDVIHEFFRENRVLIPLRKMPAPLIEGVIATEDRKFYQHWGVDLLGIMRAAVENLRAGELRQGGSTITQQLARGMFLTHERTWSRKILDALLAVRIERMYSKDEILAMYLNQVYYGEGVYGIQAAARHFFDKDATELELNECALLAGIPGNPAVFNPRRHPEDARRRRDHVLRAMLQIGAIDQAAYEEAVATELGIVERTRSASVAPYFVEMVRQHLQERYGAEQLYEGGLTVHTTLDLELQRHAEEALEEHLATLEERLHPPQTRAAFQEERDAALASDEPAPEVAYLQGALLSMDARTGYVHALVGGRSFAESAWNRVTQAHRQPGSAFKPFIYVAAIDNGFRASDIVLDTPVIFQGKTEDDEYRPANYNQTFLGPMTLRFALKKSINIPAIKLLRKVGVSVVAGYARRMGIESPIENVLSVALGSSVVTLKELTTAYTPFANHGIRTDPLYILRVEDRNGEVLEINTPRQEEVLSPETAAILTSMLESVLDSGTGQGARHRGFRLPAGGKTGTTDDFTDGWFIGFTPEIVTGVWVGFDDYEPIGEKMEGARVALPIWTSYMIEATRDSPALDFPIPPGIVKRTVCSESGMLARETCPETYEEIFKRGTEPEGLCSFHTRGGTDRLDADIQDLRELDRLEESRASGDRLRLE